MAKMDDGEKTRRFYRSAEAGPAGTGWGVLLDGRPAKTPGGVILAVPAQPLATVLAAEWGAQAELIVFSGMPATRLAFTAIDRTCDFHAEVAAEVARYAGADLLCHRAQSPTALVEREAEAWDPWLSWMDETLAVRLQPRFGLATTPQDVEAIQRVEALAAELDDLALTGLAFAASLYGSAVLAFAVAQGALDAGEAYELSRLDEAFQEEQWGVDDEAAERTARLRGEAAMLGRWFGAL